MRYGVQVQPAADREFACLPLRTQRAVMGAFHELEADPRHRGVTALRGQRGVLKVRVGDYRVLFKVDDTQRLVIVGRIAPRGRVYKRLSDLRFD